MKLYLLRRAEIAINGFRCNNKKKPRGVKSMEKRISMAVIKRLPRYYRYLTDLLKVDVKRTSSQELSKRMGITASQIRQDLNCFGGFGQQGYGYNVELLYKEIGKILGVNKRFSTIIIGAGNMGNALANYANFEKRGFDLIGIFDISPDRVGKDINGIQIQHMDALDAFCEEKQVDIAILTIPSRNVSEVAERVAELGVKGIWNFSPQDLKLSSDVVVENVHLSDSLMVLGYRIKDMEK
jgi:redox-sensing transcriptional repressor